MTSKEELLDRLNNAFEDLLVQDSDGNYCPPVCITCDRLLKCDQKSAIKASDFRLHKEVLQTKEASDVPQEIKDCYNPLFPHSGDDLQDAVADVLLSTRSVALKSRPRGQYDSLLICKDCKKDLENGIMPKWAIANGYFFGTPPSCITELTDVERAFITPVKVFGYIYVWSGGPNQKLKGTLAYYKRDVTSIAKAASQLDVLGLTEDGLRVVLTGKMTKKQKKKAKEKAEIRPQKIIEAVTWLSNHNPEWKAMDLEKIKAELKDPIVTIDDEAMEVDGYEGSNVEDEETFRIYFPDADMDETKGGQPSAIEFVRKTLEAKKSAGGETRTDIELDIRLSNERVEEYRDSNLMGACLLQYPFGRGGLRTECRYDQAGATVYPSHQEYVEHLSLISQGHFHRPLFCLILYNYLMKEWLVRTAVIRTRGSRNAECIAQKMEEEDFLEVMRQKEEKIPITSEVGRRFVKAIDAVAGAAPHSNAAALKARRKGETIQHHFGMPSIFFTVTPDDEYQVLLDIYSFADLGKTPSNWADVLQYSDEELKEYTGKRLQMRLKFPGLTSWIFQAQIDFIVKLVIGWDVNKGCRTAMDGFFGRCQAFLGGIEEQGRTTLHAHFLIWIRLLQEACKATHNKRKRKREEAEVTLVSTIDRTSSCAFLSDINRNEIKKIFSCDCKRGYPQRLPEIVGDQQLRNLRSLEGTKADPTYLSCKDCNKKFVAEEVGLQYLTKVIGVSTLKDFPDQRVKRLKTVSMVRIQRERCYDRASNAVFEASYNFHGHAPTSCFKCSSCKRDTDMKKLKNLVCEDCRYRLPKKDEPKTNILGTGEHVKWFKPDGSYILQEIKETAPKRSKLDAFQNQSVPAVGQSRLAYGNTNVALLQPGPSLTYTTKYAAKSTQEDDGADFEKVARIALKASLRMQDSNEDTDSMTEAEVNQRNRREALKRVLAVAFVLNASTVIGAPLAAYLVRNKTRFLMSHQTKWCPLVDLEKLIFGDTVSQYLIKSRASTYMTCDALDYLCRPNSQQFEDMSAFDFFGKVEVLRRKANSDNGSEPFVNSNAFKHPSFNEKSKIFAASVRRIQDEDKQKLCQIQQYFFPDTARFGGCILSGKIINEDTETYCRRAMLLFKPFRSISDLRCNGPITEAYTLEAKKREEELSSEEIDFIENLRVHGSFTEAYLNERNSKGNTATIPNARCQNFLQNIQDSAYNCLRKKNIGDKLERNTEAFLKENEEEEEDPAKAEKGGDIPTLEGDLLDELIGLMQQVNCSITNRMLPKCFSIMSVKEKGRSRCGFTDLALMNPFEEQQPDTTTNQATESGKVEESRDDNCSTREGIENKNKREEPSNHPKSWLRVSNENIFKPPTQKNNDQDSSTKVPNRKDLMNVVFKRRKRVLRAKDRFGKKKRVIQANGTAESIAEWGKKGQLDQGQRQAFEIMTSTFVLTFYNDKSCLDYSDPTNLIKFESERKKLEKLADCRARKSNQLVALMHGPGGAGKSWVIDLVLLYANEYCSFLENFEFDKRTIVVTAMTGCAATLLNGETAHGALKLNSKKVDAKDEQEWKNTRLVIVDEISFASKEEIINMHRKLQLLKANRSHNFGVSKDHDQGAIIWVDDTCCIVLTYFSVRV